MMRRRDCRRPNQSRSWLRRGANEIADTTGKRFRDLPLTRQRIKAAIGV